MEVRRDAPKGAEGPEAGKGKGNKVKKGVRKDKIVGHPLCKNSVRRAGLGCYD